MKSDESLVTTFDGHDLKIVSEDGERYLTLRSLATALGSKHRSLKKLVRELRQRGELKEGVHLKCTPFQTSGGLQVTTLVSYRGVIRISMRSDAPEAARFRDWAEEVLYGIMTGVGSDGSALRSLIEKDLKMIGTLNDQAVKQTCDLILKLRSSNACLHLVEKDELSRGDLTTAMDWVRTYYPRNLLPLMNLGGRFEVFCARRYYQENGTWPIHGESARLHHWLYSSKSDRSFLEDCLIFYSYEALCWTIHFHMNQDEANESCDGMRPCSRS